jgi:translation initiation factor 1
VTIIEGFDLTKSEIESTASDLKSSLGTGGTVDEGRIELQGDHRDRVPELLRDRGFDVRE